MCVCVWRGVGGGDFAECIAVDALVYCHEELIYVYTAQVFIPPEIVAMRRLP